MIERRVGIGEVKVEQGDVILSAYGVGSCVVIILYESQSKVGALAHILLPWGDDESLKYPKGAIDEMMNQFAKLGVKNDKVVAKIAGGATMFEGFQRQAIGTRNVNQTKEELKKLGIPVVAEDVLGNWGRSVFFNLATGKVIVKSLRHGEKVL